MVLIQVYTKCIKTKYKVRLLSKGTLIFITTTALSIILPFILAYQSKGFWMKRDIFYEFPDVRFQGKYIFAASTNNITLPIVCSSYPELMKYFKSFSSCSQIKVREIDYNNDKIIDELFLGLKINLPGNMEIFSFTLMLPLYLKLHTPSCPLEMISDIILQQQMPKMFSNLTLVGNLNVEQFYPLQCSSKKINTAFNYSSVKEEHILKNFKIENIIQNQKRKNITTTVSNMLVIQESKDKNHFMLNLKIKFNEQQFYYDPHFLQIIKWAWVQYYVIYIVIQCIAKKIMNYIFENRLVLYYEKKPNKID
ncbi:transmembrane protein 231-like [Coccinella septempunctata]|uniref:transmembrane protein 231-like n=1 Tax=Coccinella septempunctata TaxID=41139 RepID=UPI001D0746A0|nr:transmembrane protein 231-like [Coccinella septempunctata]